MLLVSFPLHPDIYSLPSVRGHSFSPAGAGGIGTGAATNSKCSSNQIDIGGTCTSKAEVSKQIISITQGVMQKEDAKGVLLRVDVDNGTVVNTGLGDSQEGVPATPDMKFRPGSMAIPMLTTVVLQLQEQGKLSLDDTLSKWFPQYANADKVTLRMLSSVTSGYPDYIQENPPFQAAQLAEPFRHWTDDELLHTRSRSRSSATRARASTTRTPTSSSSVTLSRRSPGSRSPISCSRSSSVRSGSPKRISRSSRPSLHPHSTHTRRSAVSTRSRRDGARRGASATDSS